METTFVRGRNNAESLDYVSKLKLDLSVITLVLEYWDALVAELSSFQIHEQTQKSSRTKHNFPLRNNGKPNNWSKN